ncbi:FG-GAP-like repeat-containing protein [Arthrobacter sp. zg-Y826]|uniref:GH25 family lysozyme n=1 Tax=Arthrobacter jinronghuae TaxID=2964609 RepID=UPI0021079E60|nr:GH25 family lysozyme [Arthrobacter jinronghuae]MCQ1955052.1 FG-GAP-like repeat-containing protein [Arthrobacter jinronghuae]
MNRQSLFRWLGGAVLGGALVCGSLPAAALTTTPDPDGPPTPAAPEIPASPATAEETGPAPVEADPGAQEADHEQPGAEDTAPAPQPAATAEKKAADPAQDRAEESADPPADAVGPLGARMGQGLERLMATGDPQVPTDEEIRERRDAEADPETPADVPDLGTPAKLDEAEASTATPAETPQASPGSSNGAASLSPAATWMPAGIQGLDVSSHQGNVDWQRAWNQGGRFAYVKATEGTYYKNPFYGQQYNGSKNTGMLRGAYHFAIPTPGSARAEANFFVDNGGGWSADGNTLPPLLDIEYNPYPELGNTCYNMSAGQMVSWIREFSNTIQARTGRLPMIYTTTDWWSTCTGNTSAFADHPLHIANYSTAGAGPMPAGWGTYNVWQYSSTGPFVGDSNVWNGSTADLARFAMSGPAPDRTRRVISPGDFNGDRRPDLLTRRADGTLWFHAGTGNGSFGAPRQIGSGWEVYNSLVAVGDYDGDGRNDVVARHVNGSLYRYSGTGVVDSRNEGYRPAVQIGNGGWGDFNRLIGVGDANSDGRTDLLATRADGSSLLYQGTGTGQHGPAFGAGSDWWRFSELVGARDFNGDGRVDVVARSSDGNLWLRAGNGGGSFAPGFSIGTGWDIYSTVLGGSDFNGDGKADLIGQRQDSSIWFYPGTGSTQEGYGPAARVGTVNWAADRLVVPTADFNSDGTPDLLTVARDGFLWFHPGKSSGGYGSARNIGSGWQIYQEITAVGDFNGDRRNDLLARKPDGSLWFYAGTGKVTSADEGYDRAVKVGSGWNTYRQVLGAGDLNSDGKPDLLARDGAGDLWRYYGTGSVSGRNEGYSSGTRIGSGGWDGFTTLLGPGDYDGDGRSDVLATTADGRLLLYRGSGTGLLGVMETVGTGWNAYSPLLVTSPSGSGAFRLGGVANGVLWEYRGTGMAAQGYRTATPTGSLPG